MLSLWIAWATLMQVDVRVVDAPSTCEFQPKLIKAFARIPAALWTPSAEAGAGSSWRVEVGFVGSTLRVAVWDRDQVLHLSRTVMVHAGACATAADSAALMVERYLEAIAWQPATAALPGFAAPSPEVATIQPRAYGPSPLNASAQVVVGPQIEFAGNRLRQRYGASLRALTVLEPVWLDGGVSVFAPENRPLRDAAGVRGQYRVISAAAVLRAGVCATWAAVALCAGAGAGLEWFSAQATQVALLDERRAQAMRPWGNLVAALRSPAAAAGWQWQLEVEGFGRWDAPHFAVVGADSQYAVPPAGLRLQAAIGHTF